MSAQGLINWANTSSTLISVNGSLMPPSTSPETTYNFGLFIAPIGTAAPSGIDDPNWQFVAAYTINSTAAAGAGRMQNPGLASVAGYAPGTSANFIVRAWQSTSGGNDWTAAKSGLMALGTSTLGTGLIGGDFPPPLFAFGSNSGQIGGFNILIPEPSSMALLGLGAAVMLLRRRRKFYRTNGEVEIKRGGDV